MKKLYYLLVVLLFSSGNFLSAQDNLPVHSIELPPGFYNNLQEKTSALLNKLESQTTHYREKLEKEERKLKNKLAKKHPALVNYSFKQIENSEGAIMLKGNTYSTYLPLLDSLQTTLKFLNLTREMPPDLLKNLQKLQSALDHKYVLQNQIGAREAELIQIFERAGLTRHLRSFRKQAFYYRQQLSEIKNLINDPSKLEARLLSIIRTDPKFIQFFSHHSQLSTLFAIPASGDFNGTGLQTRSLIEKQMIDRLGTDKGLNQLKQEIHAAQGSLDALKNKLNSLAYGSFETGNTEIENFRPNSQKTKSFLNRLELGSNFQSVRARHYFPVTSDLGLSLGYRLNDKSIIGLGFSYKIGWGRGWDKIAISHQGAGLRSFIDWKIKAGLFISGGYEQNYHSSFRRIAELKNISPWQSSGLLGISKKYSVSKKMNGEIRLLWDFLSYRQQPVSQPLVFRIGYQFK